MAPQRLDAKESIGSAITTHFQKHLLFSSVPPPYEFQLCLPTMHNTPIPLF
jgi:hypothetical protein